VSTQGQDDSDFLSLLLNIMSCHLICICGTLSNVYDPPIETDLITPPLTKSVHLFKFCPHKECIFIF
jgi:hypothetical protein